MNSRTLKIAPLFFILLMTFSAIAYTPTAITSNSTTTNPQIQVSHTSPLIPDWINSSTAYAIYNGHFGEYTSEYSSVVYDTNQTDIIMTANLAVAANYAHLYTNLSVTLYEFFTQTALNQPTGIWYEISNHTGLVAHTKSPDPPALQNHPSFFYIPQVAHLNPGDFIVVTTPFNQTAFTFLVVKLETVLGVETKLLATSWNTYGSSGPASWSSQGAVNLWISNDSAALLMRMKGWEHDSYNAGAPYYYYRYHDTDMSMEIGQTNILTLTPPVIPEGIVPWMRTGKYIQYDLQGSGYVDASLVNHTGGVTWQLPGDTKFRTTVSMNLTMKVDRGTTAWVDPWNSTRYVWVVHLMLNNTKLLLPDLRRSIQYLNQTLHLPVPYPEAADQVISILSPFNHTGKVADTWFLVDNETGIMLWPGIHLGALNTFIPGASSDLGDLVSQGLGLEILSYFAQSVLYQGWSIGNPLSTQTIPPTTHTNPVYAETLSGHAVASITAVGTTYLNFPGGGGGHCWQIKPNVNVQISISTMLNRSYLGYPYVGISTPLDYLVRNTTFSLGSTGYIDIERTSGFPLEFDVKTSFNMTGQAQALPYFWLSDNFKVFIELSAKVPKTNIWFSNPPVHLIAGAGGNATTPPGYFGDYGFDIWTNGAGNVTVTSSASQPPETLGPPAGTLPFIYLNVDGFKLPGSTQVILYVYFNRTKVLNLGIDENTLKIYVWNTTLSDWSALQTTHLDINATHGVLFAVLPHFSYFAVLGSPPASGGGIPTIVILIAAAAVVIVLAAVVYMKKGKGGVK